MATASAEQVEKLRNRIRDPDPDAEGIGPEDYAEDRERLLEASKVWGADNQRGVSTGTRAS